MGIPAFWASRFPKPWLVIWAFPVTLTLTLTQIANGLVYGGFPYH